MFLVWEDDYCLGLKDIDQQHKTLFAMTNVLLEACRNREDIKKTDLLMNALEDCAIKHFMSEENIQRKCGYPGLKEHKELHSQFILRLRTIRLEMRNGITSHLVVKLQQRICCWIRDHVIKEDRKYINSSSDKKVRV